MYHNSLTIQIVGKEFQLLAIATLIGEQNPERIENAATTTYRGSELIRHNYSLSQSHKSDSLK